MTRDRRRNWITIAAGYAVGAAAAGRIGAVMPPLETLLIAALLPTTAAVIEVSATTILAKDAANAGNGVLTRTYSSILFDVVLFVVALQILIVAVLSGALSPAAGVARAPIILFGLLAIGVGNLLPRTRPNLAIGIRTRRTLADRDAWIRTHRIAGSLSVVFGASFVLGGLFLSKPHVETFLGTISLAAALLLAAELLRSRTVSPIK